MPDPVKALATQIENIQKRTGKTLAQLEKLIRSSGLEKHGEIWESANLSTAKTKIRLSVHGGIGQITIKVR